MTINDGPPQGAWDIPLKTYIKTLQIVVLVYNLKNDCLEAEYPIDYGDKESRSFLGRISVWAIMNGRSVETMSKEDWEKEKIKS